MPPMTRRNVKKIIPIIDTRSFFYDIFILYKLNSRGCITDFQIFVSCSRETRRQDKYRLRRRNGGKSRIYGEIRKEKGRIEGTDEEKEENFE